MKKENFEQLKNELITLGILFLLVVVGFRVIFLAENFNTILRTVISIFWIFVLPGFAVMFYWNDKLRFYERLIIGICVGAVIIGMLSYYLGIMGLHIKYHTVLLPFILILIGVIINLRKWK